MRVWTKEQQLFLDQHIVALYGMGWDAHTFLAFLLMIAIRHAINTGQGPDITRSCMAEMMKRLSEYPRDAGENWENDFDLAGNWYSKIDEAPDTTEVMNFTLTLAIYEVQRQFVEDTRYAVCQDILIICATGNCLDQEARGTVLALGEDFGVRPRVESLLARFDKSL